MSIPFIKKLRFSSNLIDIYDAEIAAVQQAYLFGKICPYFRVVHSELKRNSHVEDDVCIDVYKRQFQQIVQHLLNEHGVHRDDDKIVRQFQHDRLLGKTLVKADDRRVDELVEHSRGFDEFDTLRIDTGDGCLLYTSRCV